MRGAVVWRGDGIERERSLQRTFGPSELVSNRYQQYNGILLVSLADGGSSINPN